MRNIACVILAAGFGVRMKSGLPKVLHEAAGVPLLGHVLGLAEGLGAASTTVVVGHAAGQVRAYVGRRAGFAVQRKRLGSGHALLQARGRLGGFRGDLLVLYGDTPLLRPRTLRRLAGAVRAPGALGAVLTAEVPDPTGYGRVVRGRGDAVVRIVEEQNASPAERAIREINVGAYCFRGPGFFETLARVRRDPVKKEFYLTDVVEALAGRGAVLAVRTDAAEGFGVNSRADLARVEVCMNERILQHWMSRGVTIRDPRTTVIGSGVTIGRDTVIHPCTVIEGPARIGKGCQIGPFARIRGGVRLGDAVCVGNFVEVVRTRVGNRTTVKHLTYLGDAVLAEDVNVGAGTITANFDGRRKHPTAIGRGAQIGSGTVLVAPVRVGERARTGAGAVVTARHHVPRGATVVGVPARRVGRVGRVGKSARGR